MLVYVSSMRAMRALIKQLGAVFGLHPPGSVDALDDIHAKIESRRIGFNDIWRSGQLAELSGLDCCPEC